MRDKIKSFWTVYKKKKRTWILIALVLIFASYFIFKTPASVTNTVTDIAKVSDLKETVLATGQVVSNTDLSLAFNSAGIVKSLKVKVGDKVTAGQVLATLDSQSEQAALTSARGVLAGAQARLKKTIEGASNEEIALSEITLNQTKLTQDTLVNNAYQNLLNSTPEAIPSDSTDNYTAPQITGNYILNQEIFRNQIRNHQKLVQMQKEYQHQYLEFL